MPIQTLEGRIPARQRIGRRGRRWCDRPRPQLVCGLPVRHVEGRTPRQRRRGRITAPDADGWQEVLQRQQTGSATTSVVSRTGQLQRQHPRKIPAELFGRCFNCLSATHQVATCRLPRRCLRCRGLHHLARDCKRPRHAVAPQRVSRGSTCAGRPVQVAVDCAGVGGRRRRHLRRPRGKLARAATSSGDKNAATTVEACA